MNKAIMIVKIKDRIKIMLIKAKDNRIKAILTKECRNQTKEILIKDNFKMIIINLVIKNKPKTIINHNKKTTQ